ncbi:ABC transporter substrate-binding protein [Novosphingobium sp. AP12]|uniref:ABC transporter substrate-binding protein n=1 Tax=Novosphingobium sp. AP12 TaxID=1144305 RepID=UPI000271D929|nr:ABC transporter substrate-binding protein [Novosphingobium sp. AP12]EJL23471.1 ABC-type branched-chain amino acid transport system, periplasmic component [Novosphingobium sp. AP12]
MAILVPRRTILAGAIGGVAAGLTGCGPRGNNIGIGLITALTAQSAKSGEAITRGLTVAIDEINANGGLLGHRLELIRRDDESNPGKGVTAARELFYKERVAVLFGGLDTPVARAIVPIASAARTPFVVPWAAGTAITHNGTDPNYVFRVSAVDELVDKAMVAFAQRTYGVRRPGLILLNNPWGQSNEKGLKAALTAAGLALGGSEKFEHSDVDVTPQLGRLRAAGADCLMMVATVGPSAQVVKSLDQMNWDVPVVSHWGPAGGRFSELAGPHANRVKFVQTYSFFGPDSPVKTRVLAALETSYPDIKGPQDVTPAVGVANAYDAMHLAALAIRAAGSLDGNAIRRGFARIDRYDGLIKSYRAPFAHGQDALGEQDYIWAQFDQGRIVPVPAKAV